MTSVNLGNTAIEILKTGRVEFASLDHDLSEMATIGQPAAGEKTGYTVCCWLEENPQFWPRRGVKVHSMNPVGRSKMQAVINQHYLGSEGTHCAR